jgi:hypothetical protein
MIVMKFEALEIPQNHIDFANMIKEAADKCGIETVSVSYVPEMSTRNEVDDRFSGDMKIHYSNVDGRKRPANNLVLMFDTKQTKVLSETPESFN